MKSSKDHVRAEYDAVAAEYERRWSRYTDRSVAETLERAGIRPNERVLDVGCGTGALLRRLSELVRTEFAAGVDLSVGMLAEAKARGITVAAADAENLPFRDASFDVVVSSSSLHFWPNRPAALREIRRMLTSKGRVVITDWCDDFLACQISDLYLRWRDPAHRRIVSGEECSQLLTGAGFDVERIDRYRISWLWGLMTVIAQRSS